MKPSILALTLFCVTGKDRADYELSGVSGEQATVRLVNLKT
jgi:hypothetical protein